MSSVRSRGPPPFGFAPRRFALEAQELDARAAADALVEAKVTEPRLYAQTAGRAINAICGGEKIVFHSEKDGD